MASERLKRQVDRLLVEGDQAITSEDWPTVVSRAKSVLAIDPENTEGIAYLAAAERALGGSAPSPATIPPLLASTAPITPPEHPTSFANGRYQCGFIGFLTGVISDFTNPV